MKRLILYLPRSTSASREGRDGAILLLVDNAASCCPCCILDDSLSTIDGENVACARRRVKEGSFCAHPLSRLVSTGLRSSELRSATFQAKGYAVGVYHTYHVQ